MALQQSATQSQKYRKKLASNPPATSHLRTRSFAPGFFVVLSLHFTGFRRQPGKRVADKYMPPLMVGAGDEVILSPDYVQVWPKALFLEHCLRFFALAKNRTRPVEQRAVAVKKSVAGKWLRDREIRVLGCNRRCTLKQGMR